MVNNTKDLMPSPLQGEEESFREIFNTRYLEMMRKFQVRTVIAFCLLYLVGIGGIAFCWLWYFPKWNPPDIDHYVSFFLMIVTLVGVIVLEIMGKIIRKIISDKVNLQKLILKECARKLRDKIKESWQNNKTRAQLAEEVEHILNNSVVVKKTNGEPDLFPNPLTSSDAEKILNKITKNRTISTTPLPPDPEDH